MDATTQGELDEITLRRAQRVDPRDSEACSRLMRMYSNMVHALLWRMLALRYGNGVVEELCQETFLRVFRALPRFNPNGPARLSTWILTIATRLALNRLRTRSCELLFEQLEEREDMQGANDLADHNELSQAVHKALGGLPDEQRVTFILREYHFMDYPEIANATQVEVGTVKSRLSRARIHIRKKLEPYL